ncbi:hypothetical protein ACQ7HM_20990 [Williamsia sp. MIQD14]|uniref:hypothetical protein n=1 Tax=Williamsia sp. MIQD14 TaxID=3425703 RepID=UPI003DA14593
MADLTPPTKSETVDQTTDLYFVRLDFPVAPDRPDTIVETYSTNSASDVVPTAETVLAEHAHVLVDVASIQLRVWQRLDSPTPALVFDTNAVPPLAIQALVEFIASSNPTPLPEVDHAVAAVRQQAGGPFDTDHALIVALNTGARANEQKPHTN